MSAQSKPVPVAYFEIIGPDAAGLVAFYRSVLGWTSPETAHGYHPITTGTGGIDGAIIDRTLAAFPPGLTLTLAVPDVARVLEEAENYGGTVVVAPVDVAGFGRFAMFADPSGNRIGLSERSDLA